MPTEYIDDYEVAYTAEPLDGSPSWGAYVAIFIPIDNPLHRDNIYPKQRVAADQRFATEAEAESAAGRAAHAILEHIKNKQSE